MSLFKKRSKNTRTEADPYTLKRVDYDIDNLPSAPRGKYEPICEFIGETPKYKLYHYYIARTDSEQKEGIVLRRSKENPSDIRNLTNKETFSCVFHDYLFQCKHNGIRGFFVTGHVIETGERKFFHWFSNETIFLVLPDGHATGISREYVNDMYVEDDELVIEVFKADPGNYDRVPTGKTNHIIKVKYEDGKFLHYNVELTFDEPVDDKKADNMGILTDDEYAEKKRQLLSR